MIPGLNLRKKRRGNKNNRINLETGEKEVNSFYDISFGLGEEDEEDVEEIHMSQNVVTTRSASKDSSSNLPSSL
jgi:hypothetical protein